MKEAIHAALQAHAQPELRRMALAEFLQHLILQSMYRQGGFKHIVFTGGTALRLLYKTDRYSEDLDFSLAEPKGYDFRVLLEGVQRDMQSQQFPMELKIKRQKTVAKADLRFKGLLHAYGLSPLKDQKLTVKCEVDENPPAGGVKEMSLVTAPVSYSVAVFALSSMFATKMHAVFYRRYPKGRDYYDLAWYLGRGVKPNLDLLNKAILQTQGSGHEIPEEGFKARLLAHLKTVDFAKIRADVERFLIRPEDAKLLDHDALASLLRNY